MTTPLEDRLAEVYEQLAAAQRQLATLIEAVEEYLMQEDRPTPIEPRHKSLGRLRAALDSIQAEADRG